MTYKQIPFTFEEWQKDPEGRKIVLDKKQSHTVVYFPTQQIISIIWNNTTVSNYSLRYAEEYFTLLIPVKTVRKWRNLYIEDRRATWIEEFNQCKDIGSLYETRFAILSAEFDESGNYVKGTVKVEEV